jgi:nucleotide-binding universal stress UspA family protein
MSEPTPEHDVPLVEPLSEHEAGSRTIVVGYDGSQPARDALAVAIDLARCTAGSTIVVACGQGHPGPLFGHMYELEERIVSELEEAAEKVRKEGVAAATACTREQPADTLITIAQETGASMIVVGAKGSGALHDAVVGSTTMRLLHRSAIPVVVVPARH